VRDTVYFSMRWKAIHGFQDNDPLESMHEWSSRLHPGDRPRVLKKLEAYLAGTEQEFWEEYRIQRKDGTYVWVLDRGIAIWDEQGRAVRMVGAETDITWRKEAEEALRRREYEFRALADNVPALFSYIGLDQRYRFVNKRYEELFGRPNEELIGHSVRELLGPDGYVEVQPYLERALTGEPVSFEYVLQAPGASTHYLSAQYVPDRDEQGQVRGVFALLGDITALKTSEAALRELSAKLLRVQEEERRRLARDLHDDVTQRLAALTLELHGMGRYAVEIGCDPSVVSHVKGLGASVERLTTDVQQLAHQLHPSILEHVGLEAAVREHVDEFATRTGLAVEVLAREVPHPLPLEQATCLYRVLQESLQNVRKHAQATNVLVRLLGTSRGVGLCVHDDGRGIENVDSGVSRKGLGLTSMMERVGMLKGTFRLRTKPGDGTEIHAWVPIEDERCEM
jgi:PAS domain S-box-containing protein